MSNEAIVDFFVKDTVQMCAGVLMLVVAWKLYRLKCDAVSDCGWFKITAANEGGATDAGNAIV